MSKNVVLINPPDVLGRPKRTFPNGYTNIGSILLEKGHKVRVLDGTIMHIDEYFSGLLGDIRQNETIFVGISAMTSQLPHAVKTARIIKEKYPNIPIVWGGVHPTLFPEEAIAEDFVDLVVIGEGEEIVPEIVEVFTGKRPGLNDVQGIMYKDENGASVFTGPRIPPDLNSMPLPKYDELFDVEQYVNRVWDVPKHRGKNQNVRMAPIVAGMGCPYRCTYCINTIVYRSGKYHAKCSYRGKSAARILDEIELLIKNYDIQYINFIDEIFFLDKSRLLKLLDGIESRQLKFSWSATVRADYFKDDYINDELAERMRSNGCLVLSIGTESGSQKILDFLKKDCSVEQAIKATELLNKHRIFVRHSFITGLPGEGHDDRLATVDLINKLIDIGPFTMISYPVIYRPMPGGPLYDECKKFGFKGPRKITDWTENIIDHGGGLIGDVLPWIGRDGKTKLTIYYLCEILGCESGSSISWWWRTTRYRALPFFLFNALRRIIFNIFQARRRFNFWYFPVEPHIYDFARKFRRFVVKRKIGGR